MNRTDWADKKIISLLVPNEEWIELLVQDMFRHPARCLLLLHRPLLWPGLLLLFPPPHARWIVIGHKNPHESRPSNSSTQHIHTHKCIKCYIPCKSSITSNIFTQHLDPHFDPHDQCLQQGLHLWQLGLWSLKQIEAQFCKSWSAAPGPTTCDFGLTIQVRGDPLPSD